MTSHAGVGWHRPYQQHWNRDWEEVKESSATQGRTPQREQQVRWPRGRSLLEMRGRETEMTSETEGQGKEIAQPGPPGYVIMSLAFSSE